MASKPFSAFAALTASGLLFLPAGRAIAQQGGSGNWHMGPGMMGGYGMMGWFGGIFSLIVWILIIVGLILLIKWLVQSTKTEPGPSARQTSSALEILKERYARGEIDKQEFEEKKKDLLS